MPGNDRYRADARICHRRAARAAGRRISIPRLGHPVEVADPILAIASSPRLHPQERRSTSGRGPGDVVEEASGNYFSTPAVSWCGRTNWTRIAAALVAHGVDVTPDALARADPGGSRDPRPRRGDRRIQRSTTRTDLFRSRSPPGVGVTERTGAALEELQAYHRAENLWELVPAFVPESLRELRANGQAVVVSNANGTVARFVGARWPGAAGGCDHRLGGGRDRKARPALV